MKLVHGLNKGIKQNIKACGYTHSVVGKSWRQRTVKQSEGVNKSGSTNIFLNYRVPLLDLPCPLSSLVICVCVGHRHSSNSDVPNNNFVHRKYGSPILGLHSRDEADMLVYKTMAKCRSSFA